MKNDSGYKTRQKEKILDYLVKNKEKHTNVHEISEFLIEEGTPVGTATIYRQLDKLVDSGTVRRYNFDGKTGACYQYIEDEKDCHEHFHLKCTV
ncbi:MAG: transcriptional repressor, partial [Prevotella sp.]|nr:transcriptional repressor [Prevotella sp.]